jgi:2-methylcitrate dehydratase PrpD
VNDLARFAANIAVERLDSVVVKATKTNIQDTLSCALAGSSAPAIAEVTGLVREWGGASQADMFVFGGKFPTHHAAWANAGMSLRAITTTRMTLPSYMRASRRCRPHSPPVSCEAVCRVPS